MLFLNCYNNFLLFRKRSQVVNIYEDPDYAVIADLPMGGRFTETSFMTSATKRNRKVDDLENEYENPDYLLPNVNSHQYNEVKTMHASTKSEHGYERVPNQNYEGTVVDVYERAQTYEKAETYERAQTYEMAQIYERAQTYERVHHLDVSVQIVSSHQQHALADQSSSPNLHNEDYEKAQVYEKAQTYERIHHCDIPPHLLPQSKLSQESITKIALNDRGGVTLGESPSHHKRIGTYERVHHCDIQPHLLTQMKQSKEPVVEQPATLKNAEITTYERIHHCDISPNLLPLSKPSQEQANVEHSIPLNKEHKEMEGEGEDRAYHEQIQQYDVAQSSESLNFATPNIDNSSIG